jgi:hypothetical protein
MSELGLDSFLTFKPEKSGKGFVFYPQPSEVQTKDGRTVVVLGNIPLPPGIPAPENALTVLYGFRDPLDEIKKQYATARKEKMSLVKVSFSLEVGPIVMGTTKVEHIQETYFLNLHRLSMDLQTIIIDGVNELSAKENKRPIFFDRVSDIGARPDLICKVIRNEPLFKHVKAVVYKVPDGAGSRQVATIFTSDVSALVFRGEMPFEIALPILSPSSAVDVVAGSKTASPSSIGVTSQREADPPLGRAKATDVPDDVAPTTKRQSAKAT